MKKIFIFSFIGLFAIMAEAFGGTCKPVERMGYAENFLVIDVVDDVDTMGGTGFYCGGTEDAACTDGEYIAIDREDKNFVHGRLYYCNYEKQQWEEIDLKHLWFCEDSLLQSSDVIDNAYPLQIRARGQEVSRGKLGYAIYKGYGKNSFCIYRRCRVGYKASEDGKSCISDGEICEKENLSEEEKACCSYGDKYTIKNGHCLCPNREQVFTKIGKNWECIDKSADQIKCEKSGGIWKLGYYGNYYCSWVKDF